MATKKQPQKKQSPPPPPKNTRMDIVLDPQRQAIIEKLSAQLGFKANTKILFHCAEYYLNDKPKLQKQLSELNTENKLLRNELYEVKSAVSNHISSYEIMKRSVTGIITEPAEKQKSTIYTLCSNCMEKVYLADIDDNICPECGEELN